jgi:hypothetical protein
MAITIIDSPYEWTPAGQKLMYVASSTNVAETGFRYRIRVVIDSTGDEYTFYIPAHPSDDNLYYDLASLVKLRNNESLTNLHNHAQTISEPAGNGYDIYDVYIGEAWIVSGALTYNAGSEELWTGVVMNGYYQVTDGYRPDVFTGTRDIRYALTNTESYVMSDRKHNTHKWRFSDSFNLAASDSRVFIPVRETDWGVITLPVDSTFMTNNQAGYVRITIMKADGTFTTPAYNLPLTGDDIEHVGVYPANLNADVTAGVPQPSDYPNWRVINVRVMSAALAQRSVNYYLYNAQLYGSYDCQWNNIRLGWVNSRGGWDYFNFNKKSETSLNIERKRYQRVLFDGTTNIFNANARGLTERGNIVNKQIQATSDWIQEGEFEFLKSLFMSNEVHWIQDDGTYIPVNVEDTTYLKRIIRDGKQYNQTITITLTNQLNA